MNKYELKLLSLALVTMGTIGNGTLNKSKNEKYNNLDDSKKTYSKEKAKVYRLERKW